MKYSNTVDWEKIQGLLPVIIQNINNGQVLMLGYMNREALEQSIEQNKVVFYSRTKERLWLKGETSGNELKIRKMNLDCDQDSMLIWVEPVGPTCHLGEKSCYGSNTENPASLLQNLQEVISQRKTLQPENSYTTSLIRLGLDKVAQKVGEEAVEVVVASLSQGKTELINETADLLYHLVVLLTLKDISLAEIYDCLEGRMTTN